MAIRVALLVVLGRDPHCELERGQHREPGLTTVSRFPRGTPNGLVLHPGGNNLSNVFTYYLDNVTLWKPASPPKIKKLAKGSGKGGVQITMDQNGQQ